MASVLFQDFLNQASQSQINLKSVEARDWFRDKAQTVTSLNARTIMNQKTEDQKNNFLIGRLYLFAYDAKHKDTLPYYDQYPLIFLLGPADGGFMGLNMHYLPYTYRARLMDALYAVRNNDRMDKRTKLNITYQLLESSSKYKYFKPTVKRYLTSQMKSKFVEIPPKEWEIALFLPLHNFKGASASKVWNDSKDIISGKR